MSSGGGDAASEDRTLEADYGHAHDHDEDLELGGCAGQTSNLDADASALER